MSNRDALMALAIIFLWGINFVVIAWGVEDVPPLLLGGLRFLLVAAIGSLFFRRPNTPIKWWIILALPMSFFQFAFLFSAIAYGMPAGLASLVLQAQALFTLIFAFLFLREKVQVYQIVAILVACLGLFFIAPKAGNATFTAFGFGLTIAGAISWALGNICTRTISRHGYDTNVNLVVWSAWIPPIPFFVCSYFFEGSERIKTSLLNFDLQSTFALLYIAIAATVICYGMWNTLLKRYPAAQVAPLTLGVPIIGLSASAILLGEHISTRQWIGTTLVLLGLLLNTFGKSLYKRFISQESKQA